MPALTRSKILIVDDEQAIRTLLSFRLQAEDYAVITAADGEEALRQARHDSPDLILLDVMLPKLDGYMVCSLLKKDVLHARIPVILFSSRSRDEDKALGARVGADAYIAKPFPIRELLETIETLLVKK